MIHEFCMAAYPFVFLGLALAVIAAIYGQKKIRDREAKEAGKESSEPMKAGDWFKANGWFVASMCMFAVGFMQWMGNNESSSATTFMCLGSSFLCLGAIAANKKNENNEENDNSENKDNNEKV